MQYDLFNQTKYKFLSLGSGSSGNCYYLGTPDSAILIDAGVGIRSINKTLREYGISMSKIHGVLITHNHADHTKSLRALGDKLSIPIYTTQIILDAILNNKYLNVSLATSKRIINKEEEFAIGDFKITAFEVPHDSIDNVGYRIKCGNQTFVLATDVGRVTDTIKEHVSQANHLVFESNYDETMLLHGRYPAYLKARIASGSGHISNREAASFLASIYERKLKNIWLCHLSQDNNHPEIAYKATEEALSEKGVKIGEDLKLEILSRYKASGLREF